MEVQLQELIEQIKKNGVDVAENEAESILASAKAEADKIISDAKAEANKILLDAKNENKRMVKSSEDSIRQAGRNVLISFRESVTRELKTVLGESVNNVYSSDSLAKLIIKFVDGWESKPGAEDISVILNSEDLKSLEDTLLSCLKDKMQKGVMLKANDNFNGGFRIAVNNGQAFYDYSADAVVDMLSNYLSPKITKLLKEAE
ncbi:MAG: V-type ATP synthase subunit E family protein [Firmicutes bacterium]|nr:V-type ATP synthase subunit E family protein [Bacillota bacterium]